MYLKNIPSLQVKLVNLVSIEININVVKFVVPVPEPLPHLETFKKKDVIEILSHKKAYNACKYSIVPLILIFTFSSF